MIISIVGEGGGHGTEIDVIDVVNCDNSTLGGRQMVKGTKFEYNMSVFNIRFQ